MIPSSPSSGLEKADTVSSLVTIVQKRLQFGDLGSAELAPDSGTAAASRQHAALLCMQSSREHRRSACRHMRQQRSSMHGVITIIRCWIGMASQSAAVIMPGEMCSSQPFWFQLCCRTPPVGNSPVPQCARSGTRVSHCLVCDIIGTKVDVGGSSNPRTWQLRSGSPALAQVHWKSLERREDAFIPRSKTCSGSSLVGSEGLPRGHSWLYISFSPSES